MAEHVTPENQLDTSDGRRYRGFDCGLAGSRSLAEDAGLPHEPTVAAMEVWYTQWGDTPADGTGTEVNAAFLRSQGLDAVAVSASMDQVDAWLDQGWRFMPVIRSNHYGYPYSGTGWVGHYVVQCWRNPDGSYHVMQPVGGVEVTYGRALLLSAYQGIGVLVRHDYRTTAPNSVTPVQGNGEKMDRQQVASAIKGFYMASALWNAAKGKGLNLDAVRQEILDPQGFNAQVDAVMSGRADLHTVQNNILHAVTGDI